ncbi:MAG: diaminobutyrate acetyltransferase [Methanothrix sp.]|jgi:L-2,4-diaminobutyric acid acetyltransferase|nr:diaminobutyrate acetyltransferase [Methanothrix sp.]OPY56971.1 MAG: Acetyltransferase (GNAT) family protein [Methanosaeta sp. PtaU1.Bin055]HNT72069.1 diaminobutyrate acetyltransferase [Methanothrix sp.]HOI69304.1 diaminobutyrate acetyltransferase [Methanothrix sp.]
MKLRPEGVSLKVGSKGPSLEGKTVPVLRRPEVSDGAKISALANSCEPLDGNSAYSYLLLCHHFADTCSVAELDGEIVGFLSGYLPPDREGVFFVWQVAVDPRMRGRGFGKLLIREVLRRPALTNCRFMETTITPSNEISRRLFRSLARDLEARCSVSSCFSEEDFGQENHEAEDLFCIGPLQLERVI